MTINIRRLNYYFLVFAIILGGTLMIRFLHISPISEMYPRVLVFVFAFLGILLEKPRFGTNFLIMLLVLFCWLFLYAVVRPYNYVYYFTGFMVYILTLFTFCYAIISNKRIGELLDIYENTILVIAVISLFFWVFGSILHTIPGAIRMGYSFADHNYTTTNYYYLYFENRAQNVDQILFGASIPRNCGIYCEVPAFSGSLLYALSVELFSHEKRDNSKVVVLVATILSTQSAKAIIILIMTFGIMYLTNSKSKSRVKTVLKIVGTIIVAVAASFLIWYLFGIKSTGSSYMARMNYLNASIKTWKSSPIFGAGFNNIDAIIANETLGAGKGGISMGLLILLATGGLYLSLFYLLAWVLGLFSISEKNKKKYLIASIMLIVNVFVSNSIFQYPYLFMISALYALFACRISKQVKLNNKAI